MDKRMMNAWLAEQAKKQELTTTKMQQKRLGIVPQAEARSKAGESATAASTPISEQLNAEEEAYAKSHKSMLSNMVDQYGKEKGTGVFYASVRNAVKKKKD
jgi:PBP1b-binding outer membrane lipoprotein LpoB